MPIPLQRVVQKTFLRVGSAVLSASGTVGSYINLPPIWTTIPIISFTQGLGEDKSVDAYESDPNPGETTTLSYIGGTLPNGISFIPASKVYRYDGIAAPGSTDTSQLRSTDNGVPPLSTDSNVHRVEIASSLIWSTTPNPSFVELTTGPSYSFAPHIPNYSAVTDEFRVTPGYSLPAWLSLTGTGSVNLTPNGAQVDANDVPSNPGIKIDVRRSGGAWVSSAAFGVTVTAVPVVAGSIDDFALEGIWYPNAFIDPQYGNTGAGGNFVSLGKHANFAPSGPAGRTIYAAGADGWHPWNNTGGSGANRFPSFTFNADGSAVTYADWYPYFGISSQPYPIGMDVVPFVWDSTRECFWIFGGNYSEFPPAARDIGISTAVGHTIIKWTAATNIWTFTGVTLAQPPGESLNGCYVPPPIDKVFWMTQGGSENGYIEWFDPANPATQGRFTIGIKPGQVPFSTLPGVDQFSDPNDRIDQRPMVWDDVRNELIWTCYKANYAGVYASSLANFPANTTTRQVYRGFEAGSTGGAQSPMAKRGRKLYIWGYPYGSDGSGTGNAGKGFIEIDIDTGVRNEAAQPYFLTQAKDVTVGDGGRKEVPWPVHGYNEGNYQATADRILATCQTVSGQSWNGQATFFRWSAPSWTPAAGFLKQLTIDIFGGSPGTFTSTFPTWSSGPWNPPGHGGGPSPLSYSGGCYARDMSTNGCFIFHGGGDGDWWGNEVYAFDFDTRKLYRLTDPSPAMTGGASGVTNDPLLSETSAQYFNIAECEHGPKVAATGACSFGDWGILPAGTQPGVPHVYSGIQWVPGSMIGNRRGAIVRPVSNFVYTTRSTGRAHYFDCDRLNNNYYNGQQWGRASKNLASGAVAPTCVVDTTLKRIYHNYGYLDLDPLSANANRHVNQSWGSAVPVGPFSSGSGSAFDTSRRLWVVTNGSNKFWCRYVDEVGTDFTPIGFTGDPFWVTEPAGMGIEYVPAPVDAFFVLNPEDNVQRIWKITLPASPKTQAWVVQRIDMAGDSVTDYSAGVRVWGRIRWVPPLKCLAFSYGGSMYLYKPVGV